MDGFPRCTRNTNMSVLTCDRKRCANVMCDRLSHIYGYICDDCFEELVGLGPAVNVEEFMQSEKGPNQAEAARARFNVEFPVMRDLGDNYENF